MCEKTLPELLASNPCSGVNERPPLEGARKQGNAHAWQFDVGGLKHRPL